MCRNARTAHGVGLRRSWSVGVSAAHLLGKEEDRVRLPDGPLEARAAGPKGRHLVCTQAIGVRVPGGPLNEHGLMVQREDARLAVWKSGFNSRSVHWIRKVAGYRVGRAALLTRFSPVEMRVRLPCLPLGARDSCPDGERDIMPRCYRGVLHFEFWSGCWRTFACDAVSVMTEGVLRC